MSKNNNEVFLYLRRGTCRTRGVLPLFPGIGGEVGDLTLVLDLLVGLLTDFLEPEETLRATILVS